MNNNQQAPQQPVQKKKMEPWVIVLIVLGLVTFVPLILAAFILIAIMLVSLGVLAYNQQNVAVQDNNTIQQINSIVIDTFNNRYSSYLGYDKSRSDVIALSQMTKANNLYEDNQVDIEYYLTDGKTYYLDSFNSSNLSVENKYDISAEYDENGYISLIKIKEVK